MQWIEIILQLTSFSRAARPVLELNIKLAPSLTKEETLLISIFNSAILLVRRVNSVSAFAESNSFPTFSTKRKSVCTTLHSELKNWAKQTNCSLTEISVTLSHSNLQKFDLWSFCKMLLKITCLTTQGDRWFKYFIPLSPKCSSGDNNEVNFRFRISSFASQYKNTKPWIKHHEQYFLLSDFSMKCWNSLQVFCRDGITMLLTVTLFYQCQFFGNEWNYQDWKPLTYWICCLHHAFRKEDRTYLCPLNMKATKSPYRGRTRYLCQTAIYVWTCLLTFCLQFALAQIAYNIMTCYCIMTGFSGCLAGKTCTVSSGVLAAADTSALQSA